MLSAALQTQIGTWLREYLAQPHLDHDLRDVAAFGALPLYSDPGGCIALRPDGRVVQVFWRKPEASFQDAPPSWRTVALVSGAARYPELRELLPKRPEQAPDCPNCVAGRLEDGSICGVCFGLGFAIR
jgi:hypothetical protein